jgi:hypothetical protein
MVQDILTFGGLALRGLAYGSLNERFIMGLQYQGGCQDLSRIITFKKYHPVADPNDSVDLLSYFVDKPSVFCNRGCHGKTSWWSIGNE